MMWLQWLTSTINSLIYYRMIYFNVHPGNVDPALRPSYRPAPLPLYMSTISAIYLRLPNWIGDVCMSLPSLHMVLDSQLPVVVCARPWARDILSAYDLAGFIDMSGRWREDRAVVNAFRKNALHSHARGILLPDSLSSAMVFKFGGIPSAGYRDDGRSLILRWPVNKPSTAMHAVESWHYIATQALKRWNCATEPLPPGRVLGL